MKARAKKPVVTAPRAIDLATAPPVTGCSGSNTVFVPQRGGETGTL
jgi:hypothetical protein